MKHCLVRNDYEGQLKLLTGNDPFLINYEGILLVHLHNEWTPVCNETVGKNEADSSC